MPSGAVSERHHGPDVDSLQGSQHVLPGLRPSSIAPNTPIFDVPNGKPVPNKHISKWPPELQPVPLVPKTTVDDDNSTLSNTIRKVKLTELTGVLTVSNPLHTQNLRDTTKNDLTTQKEAEPARSEMGRDAMRWAAMARSAEPAGGPGAKPPAGVWGLGPQKTRFIDERRRCRRHRAREARDKGAPRGPKPGGRFAARRRRRTEGGGVRRVFGWKGLIVYSVYG
ncbi:hypothetical protein GCM10010178_54740 [Lentzea flava]|uniref:Uncharacterized protein n=1 Tax=Lentzea flava TaxID=103732 RepID=A0ABQ2UXZ4_9PSEU|nr:hypothetical protein GCM10010178_54740 [Lentzea flava]